MVCYARYWENPQKHRKESRDRRNRLAALGIKRIDQFSPAVSDRQREYQKNYHRTHRAKNSLAVKRYRKKIRRLFGSFTTRTLWLYTMMKAAENAKIRKKRATNAKRKSPTPPPLP